MHKVELLVAMVAMSVACSKTEGASADTACKHVASLTETSDEKCLKEMKNIESELGKEKFAEFTSCVVKATKKDDLAGCVPKKDMKTYMNKSKATEARTSLRMIAEGARMAYAFPSIETGQVGLAPPEPSFPESVGPTPAKGSCCGELGKCEPDPTLWEHATWQAFTFAMYDPHYYSYEYKRQDDGNGFVVSAYGDLDCDGTYSTYSLSGTLGAGGEITLGDIESKDELE